VTVVDVWTGRTANALRIALRMTNESFAEHLGTAVRTVAKWKERPESVPVPELQRALDTALSRAPDADQARFEQLTNAISAPHRELPALSPSVRDALQWLDGTVGWQAGESLNRVAAMIGDLDEETFYNRRSRRSGVHRSDLAEAVRSYYQLSASAEHGFYAPRLNGQSYPTSILTSPTWLNLNSGLSPARENFYLGAEGTASVPPVDGGTANQALTRLAETLIFGTRLVNAPTYRLLGVDVSPGRLSGRLGVVDFVEYALTFDLLESELSEAVADGLAARGSLPLRDRYLPNAGALTDVGSRLCVGGPVTLTAIARNRGGRHDYVLLVQERSGQVLNAARRLAVIPKAFHQPIIDVDEESNLAMTIEREMEEELFGRPEVDLEGKGQRRADPMRPDRLSEPMRWLADRRRDDAWRMECTAFGINAISGNFECASLIVIQDESFWELYGGYIEANWEVEGLQRYSTLAAGTIESLMADSRWSNEGLFSFIQGIRRLAELDKERVALPEIEVELNR
jgi:hypothetical protein